VRGLMSEQDVYVGFVWETVQPDTVASWA